MKRLMLTLALLLVAGPAAAQAPATGVAAQFTGVAAQLAIDDLALGFYACRAHEVPPDPTKPPTGRVAYAPDFAELCPGIVAKHIERLDQERAAAKKADMEKIGKAAKQIAK